MSTDRDQANESSYAFCLHCGRGGDLGVSGYCDRCADPLEDTEFATAAGSAPSITIRRTA
jgi:hypothetical protein